MPFKPFTGYTIRAVTIGMVLAEWKRLILKIPVHLNSSSLSRYSCSASCIPQESIWYGFRRFTS